MEFVGIQARLFANEWRKGEYVYVEVGKGKVDEREGERPLMTFLYEWTMVLARDRRWQCSMGKK